MVQYKLVDCSLLQWLHVFTKFIFEESGYLLGRLLIKPPLQIGTLGAAGE